MAAKYEYRVVELREKMIGGKMSGEKLQGILNDEAARGWRLEDDHDCRGQGSRGAGRRRGSPDHFRARGDVNQRNYLLGVAMMSQLREGLVGRKAPDKLAIPSLVKE